MKILILFLTLLSSASLFWFCKHQPKFSADNLPPQQIRWGTGGGVVGKENSHTLLRNGQIFQSEMAGPQRESGKCRSKSAIAAFKAAENLGLAKLEFNHPGNMYSFIEWKDGDAVSRVAWGDAAHPVDPAVKALFDQLNGLLKK